MASPLFFDSDVGAVLNFAVKTPDGDAYNLAGGSVVLLVEGLDSFSCNITDGAAGLVTKTVAANEFPTGRYRAQLKTTVNTTVLHTGVFIINIGNVVDFSGIQPVIPTPAGSPSPGAIPFGSLGGGSYTEDAVNLVWDDNNNILKLFGGAVGTSAQKIVTLGIGTGPTTSPANSVQFWAADLNGVADSASLHVRDEGGNVWKFGHTASFDQAYFQGTHHSGNQFGFALGSQAELFTDQNIEIIFTQNGTPRLNISANGNIGIGNNVYGTAAAKVIAVASGTAPTTPVGDGAQLWVQDTQSVANRAAFHYKSEDGTTKPVDPVLFRYSGAPFKDVNTTAAATSIFSSPPTIKGGTLGTDRTLEWELQGDYLNNTGGGASYTVTIIYGATTVSTLTPRSAAFSSSATRRGWEARGTLTASGATNTQFAKAIIFSPDTVGVSGANAVFANANEIAASAHNAVAEDGSVDKTFDIKLTPSSNSANNSIRVFAAKIKLV